MWKNLQKEHCTPAQAAEIAEKAKVKQLVVTHFLPNTYEEDVINEVSAKFSGSIIVAKDLQIIDVI